MRLSSYKHKWAVLSPHERSGACLDTMEQLRESCHGTMSALVCSWVIMSAQECSLCHGTMLKSAYDWPWLPMSTEECSLVLLRVHGAMIMSVDGCSGALMSTNEHSSVLKGSHGLLYALLSMLPWHSEHTWVLVSTHEQSILYQWTRYLKQLLSIAKGDAFSRRALIR